MKNEDFNFKKFVKSMGLDNLNNRTLLIEQEIDLGGRYSGAGEAEKSMEIEEAPADGGQFFKNKELKKAVIKDIQKSIKAFPKPVIISDQKARKYADQLHEAMIGSIEGYTRIIGVGLGTNKGDVEKVLMSIPTVLDISKVAREYEKKYSGYFAFEGNLLNTFIEEFGTSDFRDFVAEPIKDKSETAFITFSKKNNSAISYEKFQEMLQGAEDNVKDIDIEIDDEEGNKIKVSQSIEEKARGIVELANRAYEKEVSEYMESFATDSDFYDSVPSSMAAGGAATGVVTVKRMIDIVKATPRSFTYLPGTGREVLVSSMDENALFAWNQYNRQLAMKSGGPGLWSPSNPNGWVDVVNDPSKPLPQGSKGVNTSTTYKGKVPEVKPKMKTFTSKGVGSFSRPGAATIPRAEGLFSIFEPVKITPAAGTPPSRFKQFLSRIAQLGGEFKFKAQGLKGATAAASPGGVRGLLGAPLRSLSFQAIRNIGFGAAARGLAVGFVRGLTSPLSLAIFVLSLADYFFNSADEEDVKDVAAALTPTLYSEIVKMFATAKKESQEVLDVIKGIPFMIDPETKKKREEQKKQDQERQEQQEKIAQKEKIAAAIIPLTGMLPYNENTLAKIRHVMNKYSASRDLGLPPLTTDDSGWSQVDLNTWSTICPHILENSSRLSPNPTTQTILSSVNFSSKNSWREISAAYRFDYPGYTSDKLGMLMFLIDGYNDKDKLGKRSRGKGGQSPPAGGEKNKNNQSNQQDSQTRKRSSSGVGLRPRNVRIKVFGVPSRDGDQVTLDEITSPGTSIQLKRLLVDNIKSTNRGTIIEPSETLMMIIRVDQAGNLVNVRKARGQFGDFNNFKRGTWRKIGIGKSRLHNFLAQRRFKNLGGATKFEIHFTFPAGFYDQS